MQIGTPEISACVKKEVSMYVMRNDMSKQIKHNKKSPCNSIMLHRGGIQRLGSVDKHPSAN